MMLTDVSVTPVVVGAVLNFVLGWFWYSPKFFGNMCGTECCEKKEESGCNYSKCFAGFLVSLVTVWVFAALLKHFGVMGLFNGAELGFYIWLGFIATTYMSSVIWCGESFKSYLVDVGFQLVSLLFLGAFLSYWK